jgi:hypothetical protein
MTFTKQLRSMNACREAIEWANDRSFRKCWQVCNRPDWMLWLIDKLGICETEQHELACDFAERVLKYVPKGEDRPREAIETKRRWLRGEASDQELATARAAAVGDAWAAAGAAWDTAEATEHKAQCRLIRKCISADVVEAALNALATA